MDVDEKTQDTAEPIETKNVDVKQNKRRKKDEVEEYHIDPEKILKYTRGGRVRTKV
jgi:hypothetical protein